MQPRVFPIALMAANLAFAVTLFFNYRAEPPKKIKMEGLRTWGSIVLFGVFYLITIYLDMLIAIAVVMFVMCLLWGERRIHIAAVISLRVKDLLTASVIFGIYSFLMCLLWAEMGAVDVAFTEAAVGAGVSAVFLIATVFNVKRGSSD